MPTATEQNIPIQTNVDEVKVVYRDAQLQETVHNMEQQVPGIVKAEDHENSQDSPRELTHLMEVLKATDTGSKEIGFDENEQSVQQQPPAKPKRSLIQSIIAGFGGMTVGLENLASSVGEEAAITAQRTTPPRFTESGKFEEIANKRAQDLGQVKEGEQEDTPPQPTPTPELLPPQNTPPVTAESSPPPDMTQTAPLPWEANKPAVPFGTAQPQQTPTSTQSLPATPQNQQNAA